MGKNQIHEKRNLNPFFDNLSYSLKMSFKQIDWFEYDVLTIWRGTCTSGKDDLAYLNATLRKRLMNIKKQKLCILIPEMKCWHFISGPLIACISFVGQLEAVSGTNVYLICKHRLLSIGTITFSIEAIQTSHKSV